MAKRYEELTIADDFMFGKVMEDKVLCRDALERLLEEKVGVLENIQTQREFRYVSAVSGTSGRKGIVSLYV